MRHSISLSLLLLTAGSIAHADRYAVRDAKTGRFVKAQAASTSTAVVKVSPETALVPTKVEAAPAPEKELASHAPEKVEHIALAPASNTKPSLMSRAGSWLKNNFTVSREASDHMVAAKALRKEGRLGEAATQLTSAPAPRGFVERIMLGHSESKLRSTSMTAMKDAAREGRVHDAAHAYHALVELQGTMGAFAKWRAKRAVSASAKLSISAARIEGKHGDLDGASDSVALAKHFGASDRQLDKANARLENAATKQAKLAAKHGDLGATQAALVHAGNVPGTQLTEDTRESIMGDAISNRMTQLVKAATRAYKHGDAEGAAFAMAELQDLRESSRMETSGGVHRDEVRMTALLGSRIEEAHAVMMGTPEAEEHAENDVKAPHAESAKAAHADVDDNVVLGEN